jgi:hypothetical protein
MLYLDVQYFKFSTPLMVSKYLFKSIYMLLTFRPNIGAPTFYGVFDFLLGRTGKSGRY